MREALTRAREWVRAKLLLGRTWPEYARELDTAGNRLAALIVAVGLPIVAYRFSAGLGAVTNLSQDTPWGLWIGFDMLCGVALAAGGYTLASAVYILGLERYRPVVRPAILTGFLGYVFAVLGLLCDLGQPWRIPYPIFYKQGVTSVMFEVGCCVFLYLMVLGLEFTPAVFEWLGWPRLRRRARDMALGLTAFGVVLSTLHQSSLGSLFLSAPGKVHPLWYSPFLPVFFFISSVVAGLSMVIVESALSHRAFHHRLGRQGPEELDALTVGLGRAAALVLFTLFFLRLQGLAEGGHWVELATPYGGWYVVEVVGLILVPCLLFARAAHARDASGVRFAAALAVLGVIAQRLDVSIIGFQWNVAHRYVPSVAEVIVSVTLVTLGVAAFRWIVNRMPVLDERELAAGH